MPTLTGSGPTPRRRAVLAAGLIITIITSLLTLSSMWPARAATFANLGPVDPTSLIPQWYTDANGTSLQPCLDGPPLCFSTTADLLDPAQGEAFYELANVDLNTSGGLGLAEFALEAALFNGPPEMSVFQRVRFRFNTTSPGVFTITHPFGQQTFTVASVGAGFEINDTVDAGCFGSQFNTCNDGIAPEFDAALTGPMGTFLEWDPAVAPAAPAGFIGDNATPHAVIGSPLAQNFVRIDGPDIGGPGINTVQTNLFTMTGKRLPGVSAKPATVAFPDTHVGVVSTPTAVTLTNTGTAALPFTASLVGTNPADFRLPAGGTCAGAIPAGRSCTLNVAFAPLVGALGARTATLNIAHGALGSPATVPLSGNALPAIPATPTGTPAPGTYLSPQAVTLAAASPGVIHFTTNGTPATAASPAVSGPIALPLGTTTIRAVNVDALGSVSPEATLSYTAISVSGISASRPTITIATAATPLGISGSSVGASALNVVLDDANAVATPAVIVPATITPVAGGQTWSASFSGAQLASLQDGTLTAIVMAGTSPAGSVTVVKDTVAPGTPVPSLTPGTYQNARSIVLTAEPLAVIHFVQNGTATASSPVLAAGQLISLPEGTSTVSAVAVDNFGNVSPVGSFAYTIQLGTNVDKASLNLGSAVVAQTSAPGTVTVTNDSPRLVTIQTVGIGGTNGADFALGGGTCGAGTPLAPGGTCTVIVSMTPSATGTRSGTVTITDDSAIATHTIALSGLGLAQSRTLAISTTLVDFLKIPTGTVTPERLVTITSTGNTAAQVNAPTITGANANQFAITSNTCGLLAPTKTCTIGVTFAPTVRANAAGTLTVTAAGANTVTAALKGVGDKPLAAPPVPPAPAGPTKTVSLNPTTLAFNKTVLNTSAIQTVTVTSTGTVATPVSAVLGGANANQYTLTSDCPVELAPAATCTLTLVFHPTVRANANATITVSGPTVTSTITVKGSVR